jgi:hypothetical protein
MFDRSLFGYPYPSLVEHLVVFGILFLIGTLWASCVRWYVEYRMKANAHE